MGGKSGSTSQANQSTSTNYNDGRVTNRDGIVVGDGSALDMSQFFVSDDSQHTNLSSWDASTSNYSADNSLKLSTTDQSNKSSWSDSSTSNATTNTTTNNSIDPTITGQAFDFAKGNDATLGAGLSSVLSFAKDITTQANENTSSLASMFGQGVNQAYDGARNTTAGGIDNKTMIVLGVAGAAALAFAMKKG